MMHDAQELDSVRFPWGLHALPFELPNCRSLTTRKIKIWLLPRPQSVAAIFVGIIKLFTSKPELDRINVAASW